MPITKVVNKYHDEYDVDIGRPSKWGNPFKISRDGSREQVIIQYRNWLLSQRKDLLNDLNVLKGKRLGCYCKPQACHGDVLVKLLETKYGNKVLKYHKKIYNPKGGKFNED